MIGAIARSLGARILLLAALNLALLRAIGMAAAGVRVPRSPSEMLMQASADRLLDISRQVTLDLSRTPREGADAMLDRYSDLYAARFLVVTNQGVELAGARLELPPGVRDGIAGPPPGAADDRRRPPEGEPRGGLRPPPPGPGRGPRLPGTPPFLMTSTTDPRYWIGIRMPIQFAGATEIIPGTMLIASDTLMQPLLMPGTWIGWALLALVVTLMCWWPVLRGITKSLGRMEHATQQIAEGRFEASLAINRSDEIGRLSQSIERMAGRLGALVSGQKRFLGDTAHELRSPLGRMQVALEILDTRVQPAERAYVADLKEDVVALSSLTDELLQFARAELSERPLALVPVKVLDVANKIALREAAPGVTINVQVPSQTVVSADAALFERALANVVRNAVRYAGDAGPIDVSANAIDGTVSIVVCDSGPGVAEDAIGRVFDPFFRVDEARNRRTGGAGLGLAIVRSAVEACGGTVTCRNRQPHGLEVTLTLNA